VAQWMPSAGCSTPTRPSAGRYCATWWSRPRRSSPLNGLGWPSRVGAPGCWPGETRTASGRAAPTSRDTVNLPRTGASGEVEPCINGLTVALGVYFGHPVDDIVTRWIGEQLGDGGWNCWADTAPSFLPARPPSMCSTVCWLTSRPRGARPKRSRPVVAARNTYWNAGCSGARARATSSTRAGCSSRTRPAGTTTSSAP
jgi:hypothetical protein